jgi:RNA polymerase sigma factor (sigma-70 family)
MTAADIHHTILTVWRIEQPRLITSLARMLRDVPLAEDLTQEALLAALEHWPATGVPQKPGAWLMATAKRRALDHLRRGQMLARKHEMLASDMEQEQQDMPDWDLALDDDIGDELLRLIFTACHPLLSREARAALALRMICGLTTEEIARAFLQPEATIAQRLVRAKRTLSESGLGYETPRGEELSQRLASVLEVVYLIFNEGYTAARGEHWLRPQLCDEALRMGRVLTSIAPHEPEAHGLLALMELNASRTAARTDVAGEPILLLEQNRVLWDQFQIRRGHAGARASARAWRSRRLLRPSGGDYRLPRRGADGCSNRLVAHIRTLRGVGGAGALAHHRTQPRGGHRYGRGPASGARDRGRPCARARAQDLSFAGKCSRRPAAKTRPLRGSARCVRSGGKAGGQQARTGSAEAPRRRTSDLRATRSVAKRLRPSLHEAR